MSTALASLRAALTGRAREPADRDAIFEHLYEEHFAFVWRSLRRLGVPTCYLDDAVQDVFLVVHRRLDDFEGRSSMRTWLFGILLRVARQQRRTSIRKRRVGCEADADLDAAPGHNDTPHVHAERNEARRTLHAILDELDEDKRTVFVMAELEQMTKPEIAALLDVNVNTIYSRLRAARAAFDAAVARLQADTDEPSAGGTR